MEQQPLWQDDSHTILKTDSLEHVGRFRLQRFLNWLDSTARSWQDPDLNAFGEYLVKHKGLSPATVESEKSRLRLHYRLVLSDPQTLHKLPPDEREALIHRVMHNLGYSDPNYELYRETTLKPQNSENLKVIMPKGRRVTALWLFTSWLDKHERHWSQPDLNAYKRHLRTTRMKNNNIKNHLTLIRRRYEELIEDKELMRTIPAEQRADLIENFTLHLGYRRPGTGTPYTLQDDPNNRVFWLNQEQVTALINGPDTSTLKGLRDRAILGIATYFGLQQAELTMMDVQDAEVDLGEAGPGLRIKSTLRRGERLIPYRHHADVLEDIKAWFSAAEITEGIAFRSPFTSSKRLRENRINPTSLSKMLATHPVEVNGRSIELIYPDLKCTAGRIMLNEGLELDTVMQHLGFSSHQTVMRFLGIRKVYLDQ